MARVERDTIGGGIREVIARQAGERGVAAKAPKHGILKLVAISSSFYAGILADPPSVGCLRVNQAFQLWPITLHGDAGE